MAPKQSWYPFGGVDPTFRTPNDWKPHTHHREGMKLTLSAHPRGLTRDKRGRKLLEHPFVFQCGPLESFKITHQFNQGTYDTIVGEQYSRRGSHQLIQWQFDTLAMYLGVDQDFHVTPHFVPFPNAKHLSPFYYRNQMRHLLAAGCPFRFVATSPGDPEDTLRTFATLTGFGEDYKHGEGDAIYLEGVTFSEWRDPEVVRHQRGKQPKKHRGQGMSPTSVTLRKDGFAYDQQGRKIGDTLAKLAKHFYGDPSRWRLIAEANNLKGGANEKLAKVFKSSYTSGFPRTATGHFGLPFSLKIPPISLGE